MSFKLVGKNPESAVGKELNISLFIWHPLWEYVESQYPEIAIKVGGHFNSYQELSKEDALFLSNNIYDDINNNIVAEYVRNFKDFVGNLPLTDCYSCFGIGKHRVGILKALDGPCEACNGTGRARFLTSYYSLELQDFYIFQKFLSQCGGFIIQ